MSKLMTLQNAFNLFEDRKVQQTEAASRYEEKQSYEMSYLALWSVVEHTIKNIGAYGLTQQLKERVSEWNSYLEFGTGVKPKAIKNFSIEIKNIPAMNLISCVLGDCPAISKLLQTKEKGKSSKYRDTRNDIAHNATKFGKFETYLDYKETANRAIEEIELLLKLKITQGIEHE